MHKSIREFNHRCFVLVTSNIIAIATLLAMTTGSAWGQDDTKTTGDPKPKSSVEPTNGRDLWTLEDGRAYAHRNYDPSKWNPDRLKGDLEAVRENKHPIKPALSDYPSPVADYDWGYGMIGKLETRIGERTLKGTTVGYAIDSKYHPEPAAVKGDYFATRFNLLILTDHLANDGTANHIVSRNYPHYLATGSQLTSQGRIDWVQLTMADGRNLAIISQRVFDLEFGKTIVVIPHDDGSLRFLQLEESPVAFPANPFEEVGNARFEKYYNELNQNTRLLELLKEPGVLPTKLP